MRNEDYEEYTIQNEVTTSAFSQVSVEDIQNFNLNVVTGFLGVTASLGIACGLLFGIMLKDIFK